MSTKPTVIKPEEEELNKKRQELAGLESELADGELRISDLRAKLAVFERHYLRIVGTHYAELDEIEAKIAELFAQNHPSDQEAQHSAKQARLDAENSRTVASSQGPDELKEFVPSSALKSLYRDLAKLIHPDLTADPAERNRRQRLMAEANLAYERNDEARLRKILRDFETSPEAVQGEGTAAELVRTIRKIAQARNRIKEIDTEVGLLVGSDLYKLMQKAEEAKTQGRDLLNEMAEAVDCRIATARERLREASRS